MYDFLSLIETIALNCLGCEKIAFFGILATDRQTNRRTKDGHHQCVKPQSRYRELRLNNNLRSCVSGATCEVFPVFSYLLD